MGVISNVQIWHPGAADGKHEGYWREGDGGKLSALYGEVLGMKRINIG